VICESVQQDSQLNMRLINSQIGASRIFRIPTAGSKIVFRSPHRTLDVQMPPGTKLTSQIAKSL
jgi:hypothetical protein